MTSDRTRDLLLPITILISVAVGAVIGGSFARSDTHSTTSPADPKALVDASESLRAELARTREQSATLSSTSGPTERTETRTAAPDMTSELRRATAQLTEAAESLHASASRAGGDRQPLIPPATVDPKALQEVLSQTYEVNTKTCLLWTYQQVMDRFGPPNRARREEGGTCWKFAAQSRSVFFDFVDGRVVSVRN
jgi:hypothetical protein